jgi:hypothetical protein
MMIDIPSAKDLIRKVIAESTPEALHLNHYRKQLVSMDNPRDVLFMQALFLEVFWDKYSPTSIDNISPWVLEEALRAMLTYEYQAHMYNSIPSSLNHDFYDRISGENKKLINLLKTKTHDPCTYRDFLLGLLILRDKSSSIQDNQIAGELFVKYQAQNLDKAGHIMQMFNTYLSDAQRLEIVSQGINGMTSNVNTPATSSSGSSSSMDIHSTSAQDEDQESVSAKESDSESDSEQEKELEQNALAQAEALRVKEEQAQLRRQVAIQRQEMLAQKRQKEEEKRKRNEMHWQQQEEMRQQQEIEREKRAAEIKIEKQKQKKVEKEQRKHLAELKEEKEKIKKQELKKEKEAAKLDRKAQQEIEAKEKQLEQERMQLLQQLQAQQLQMQKQEKENERLKQIALREQALQKKKEQQQEQQRQRKQKMQEEKQRQSQSQVQSQVQSQSKTATQKFAETWAPRVKRLGDLSTNAFYCLIYIGFLASLLKKFTELTDNQAMMISAGTIITPITGYYAYNTGYNAYNQMKERKKLNVFTEAIKALESKTDWDIEQFITVIQAMKNLKDVNVLRGDHPKILFILRILSIYGNIYKHCAPINPLSDDGLQILTSLDYLFQGLQNAADAHHLFLSEEIPNDTKGYSDEYIRLNNYLVAGKAIKDKDEQAYAQEIVGLLKLGKNVDRIYEKAYIHANEVLSDTKNTAKKK